ncbi:hypothetical protein [Actinomadura alba]|uniref:Lipoprotein n=1 Tax=Actinomadura alba TaxID=406431 RepID=A0ABR7LUL9_9ACTN|nr:hypothetical protein [Actinomadura alba]MBC6468547.1 hypothetical protein [Actinomadura alba]
MSANARTTTTTTPKRAESASASPIATKAVLAFGGAVTALAIAACGGAEGAPPARNVAAGAPQVTASVPTGTAAKLPVTEALRKQLADAYFASQKHAFPKGRRERVIGPTNISYGIVWGFDRVPKTYYAVGSTGFTNYNISRQGGPHVWRKEGDADWTYLGDTGLTPCTKVPRELYTLWGFDAKYGSYSQCSRRS